MTMRIKFLRNIEKKLKGQLTAYLSIRLSFQLYLTTVGGHLYIKNMD